MSERLDEKTKAALRSYLADVRSLPNESAKTHRFATLIGELFPGSSAVTEFAAGVEKLIRIDTAAGQKRGRIDTYYGNAVIEFENSLRATGKEAEHQLRGYVSGVWAKEGKTPRPLVAIASDGIKWLTYRPTLSSDGRSKPRAEDVELEPLRELTLSERTLADFWVWLTSLLFRPQRIEPSAEQFRLDFGATSPAFRDAIEALRLAWEAVGSSSEPRLAFETWQKYLTVTYGRLTANSENGGGEEIPGSELEALFLKHTYLASVARLLVWASVSKGKTTTALREVAGEVLSGRFFESRGLANLVENDFFQWVRRAKAEVILAPIWERIIAQILSYDLGHLGEDVLKGVYQELVDPKDRHDLGEYYTPDWLCELVVAELMPPTGFARVLDPACGSGSFLRAAIAHLLRANQNGSEAARLQGVLENVVGIDVHPLAVTISKATYLLALGPLVKAAKRPVQIPVYLADSLFLPAEVKQLELGQSSGYEIRFGGDRRVTIPENVIRSADLFDGAIAACTEVALDHAKSNKESPVTLRSYLAKALPTLREHKNHEEIVKALWQFTEDLAGLIRKGKNSIWAFIVRNAYRPAMLKEHFDLIVGNPPWLSYRYIADPDYQAEVKQRAVVEYAIAPKSQKLMTHMELATVFLAHSMATFARDGARLGFVMPRSVLSADQHDNLRKRTYKAPFRLTGYWDLMGVQPLFKVPCCVLFGERGHLGTLNDALRMKTWEGKLPAKDLPWRLAKDHLHVKSGNGGVIFLGERTALSAAPGRTHPNQPSPYAGRFRQGATIVPRNFYFVRIRDLEFPVDPERLYWAETDPEQAEDAKPPYKEIRLSGHVEGRFIYCTALSKHIVPFAVLEPATVVLSLWPGGDGLVLRSAEELRHAGFREFAAWMKKAERIWNEKRERKAARQNVYERLDYQGELTDQNLGARYLVLYNAAGTNLAAACVDRQSLPLQFIVEHKLYWAACTTPAEADYVAAVLNSEAVNEAIKPFQSMGLMGERDIEKKVLDLPFPAYSSANAAHQALAELAKQAREKAAVLVRSPDFPPHLARRRGWMREQLHDFLAQIDSILRKLI